MLPLRQAEVNQFELSVVSDHNVFWFDISVNNSLGVHVVQSSEQFLNVLVGNHLVKYLIFLLSNLVEQLSTSDVFHHKVNVSVVLVSFVVPHDVGVVELG